MCRGFSGFSRQNGGMTFEQLTADPNVAFAMRVAQAAGDLLLKRPVDLEIETKSTSTDVVTLMDKMAEALIVEMINAEHPEDGILGEEGTDTHGSSGLQWVIDPIDGTVNYLYQLPHWCVSIGLVDAKTFEGIVGVVFAPVLGRMYISSRGLGAWVVDNGTPRKLEVSGATDLGQSLMGTGFGYSVSRRTSQARILNEILPKVRDIRRLGSCAIDLCLVAEGLLDGYYERGVNPWDHAAGGTIAREAGATVSGLHGKRESSEMVIAVTPGIYEALRVILETQNADQD